MSGLGPRGRLALTVGATALLSFVLAVLAPLREISGDTVPGRIGGAVLRCTGSFDLSRADWIRAETEQSRMFYYMQRDQTGEFTSIFGPVPAVVGALALVGTGDTIDDATLRSRERGAAALLVALAVALLTLAAAARCSLRRSALTGITAAAAFCGAATLGQGLWQATTALPFLVGGLATLAWRERMPRLALVTPALLLLAVMMRPTLAPVVVGLGITWAVRTRDKRTWILATAIALAAASPLILWNVIHLWSPLPLGQWHGNKNVSDSVFTVGHVGLAGLLVSPARGLLWFAPLVVVGVIQGLRTATWRWIAAGIVLQLVVMACFFKWHGGLAYGPRLLAEASWIGIWLALGSGVVTSKYVLAGTAAITIVIGQLGLWRWQPEQWETRRLPEAHHGAYWDFVDSPVTATFTDSRDMPRMQDSPRATALTCDGETLRSARP